MSHCPLKFDVDLAACDAYSRTGDFSSDDFDAIADLRGSFDRRSVYFGQRDEELYVLEKTSKRHCAIEFVGAPVWGDFENDIGMFEFMLGRTRE